MGLLGLSPMLRTTRLQESVEFYEKVLGFACEAFEEEWGWASMRRDEVVLMLAGPNEHMPMERAVFTGSLYIRTNEIDELWERLKNAADVCYPLEDFEYGMREFAVYDNNGYLLQFGQAIGQS